MFVLYYQKVKDINLIPVYNFIRDLITMKWPVLIIDSLSFMKCS